MKSNIFWCDDKWREGETVKTCEQTYIVLFFRGGVFLTCDFINWSRAIGKNVSGGA